MNKPMRAPNDNTPPQEKKVILMQFMAEEERKHKRSGANNQKSCQRCGFCCLRQPCVPTPKEFKEIAAYFKMSPQQFFKESAVVSQDISNGFSFFVMWARETQEDFAGSFLPDYRTFDIGYCIFYDKLKRACIMHEVVPQSAKQTKCWEKKQKPFNITWTVEDIKEIYPDFDPNQSDLYYFTHNDILPL